MNLLDQNERAVSWNAGSRGPSATSVRMSAVTSGWLIWAAIAMASAARSDRKRVTNLTGLVVARRRRDQRWADQEPPAPRLSAMKAVPPDQPAGAAPDVIEWRPNLATAVVWNLLAVPMMLGSLLLFFRLATLHLGPSERAVFRPVDLLVILLLTVVVTAALLAAHEGLHGLVMAGFGARPRFGALMIARLVPALFTTAPGYLFTRPQYLGVALTPAAIISTLGHLPA